MYTQALGKQRQQPLPTGTSQLRHPLLVCRLSLPPNSTASAAVGVVRGQLLPTHRFPNGHFTTTRRGYLENWLSRARLLSGQDCHKIRLPLELKGPHRGGQGGRRKQRKARMLWALLRGLSVNLELVNCFLKFTILLKTGVISSSPWKQATSHLESWKGILCLNFLSPSLFPNNCNHSNNKFGPLFKFVLSFGFPFKNM